MDLQEMSGVNYKMLSDALQESTESLQEDNARLRNTNRILRKVTKILRKKLEEAEKHSDELMIMLDNTTEAALALNEEAGAHQAQADMLMLELDAATPDEGVKTGDLVWNQSK